MKTSLAVTSTRQPDDPLLHVLAEVDVSLVDLQVDPGEDVDQALHLLPVRLAGHGGNSFGSSSSTSSAPGGSQSLVGVSQPSPKTALPTRSVMRSFSSSSSSSTMSPTI